METRFVKEGEWRQKNEDCGNEDLNQICAVLLQRKGI